MLASIAGAASGTEPSELCRDSRFFLPFTTLSTERKSSQWRHASPRQAGFCDIPDLADLSIDLIRATASLRHLALLFQRKISAREQTNDILC
jgi:hypothetical protein